MAALKDRYANALVELSEENGTLEADLEQVVLIRDVIENDEVQAFLVHPNIPDLAKQQFFHNVFLGQLSDHLMGFLYLMIRNNREAWIVPALDEYIKRARRRLGRIEAKVVSAKALTETQIELIRRVLMKKTGMDIEINAVVDPDVIGGFYILVDGYVFDRTIRSALHGMRERLVRGGYG